MAPSNLTELVKLPRGDRAEFAISDRGVVVVEKDRKLS